MLFSCSDEMTDGFSQQNAHSGDVMGVNTYDLGTGYISPYDTDIAGDAINYVLSNQTQDLELFVTPYISLAYYDAADDGYYYHSNLSSPVDLSNGNYPNLYGGNKEYGNLIANSSVVLNGLSGVSFYGDSNYHCPTPTIFALGSVAESTLLGDFGKVYFYEVIVRPNNVPGTPILEEFIQLDPGTIGSTSPNWTKLSQTDNISGADLYVNTLTNEIVPVNGMVNGKGVINGSISFFNGFRMYYLNMTATSDELRLELTDYG